MSSMKAEFAAHAKTKPELLRGGRPLGNSDAIVGHAVAIEEAEGRAKELKLKQLDYERQQYESLQFEQREQQLHRHHRQLQQRQQIQQQQQHLQQQQQLQQQQHLQKQLSSSPSLTSRRSTLCRHFKSAAAVAAGGAGALTSSTGNSSSAGTATSLMCGMPVSDLSVSPPLVASALAATAACVLVRWMD
jgi:TolA-binding protein